MKDSLALPVDGQVDSIRRLKRDPPQEYTQTAWSVDDMDGETVLIETAIIECPNPDCNSRAYWAAGVCACGECETSQRLIG